MIKKHKFTREKQKEGGRERERELRFLWPGLTQGSVTTRLLYLKQFQFLFHKINFHVALLLVNNI